MDAVPARDRAMRELIADGAVGEVRAVQVDLGVRNPLEPGDRFVAPELGGGALFDLTVYPISFAQMVLGDPTAVSAHGVVHDGVDLEESVVLAFAGGHRDADRDAALRDARAGAGLRHRGLDRRAAALPPPRHDRAAPPRPRPEEITLPAVGGGYSTSWSRSPSVAAGRARAR